MAEPQTQASLWAMQYTLVQSPKSVAILSCKKSSVRFQRIPLTATDLEIRRVQGSRYWWSFLKKLRRKVPDRKTQRRED